MEDTTVLRQAPHDSYRLDLLRRIRDVAPASLLDVGCGDGALLRAAALAGCSCVGLETDEEHAAAWRQHALDVRLGRAEALPFADRSFDVVVLQYVAHHLGQLDRALVEAARVARRAVLILDPWFDLDAPSQRVAHDFDLWLKVIDRRTGMVHHPCIAAGRLARPFEVLGGFELDWAYRLLVQPIPVERMEQLGQRQLATVPASRDLERRLEELLDQARLHGWSHDGSICFAAIRTDAPT